MDIDWLTRVITIFKTDTFVTLVGGTNYDVDTNGFRLAILDRLDDVDGMPNPRVFSHNTTVLLGGIEYARVLEVINGYTITFDDTAGAWIANLVGSNNNILDNLNLTAVQVRSNNSAGLINVREVQQIIFNEAVYVDTLNGTPGTLYPQGTPLQPVDNIPDAIVIAGVRGFSTLNVIGDITLDSGDDIAGYKIVGQNAARTTVTVNANADTIGCEILEAYVTGTLDGGTVIRNCVVANLEYVNGFVFNCMLDPGMFSLGGTATASFLNCYSGQPGVTTPTLDCDGLSNTATAPLAFRNYSGGIKLTELTGGGNVSMDFSSGQLIIDSTCTSGTIVVRGDASVMDSAGAAMPSGTYNTGLTLINETTSTVKDLMESDQVRVGDKIFYYQKGSGQTVVLLEQDIVGQSACAGDVSLTS